MSNDKMINNKEIVLLDLTTSITLVSDCCTQKGLLEKFGEKWRLIGGNVYDQLVDEKKDPVYSKLLKLFGDKQLAMVRTAYDKFIHMIDRMGSETERHELKKLQDILLIIEPEPTKYFINLGGDKKLVNHKKWSIENIDTFGTADNKGYTVYTGNFSIALFLQERQDQLTLKCQPHRPRSFVGKCKYLKLYTL